jgi:glycosyltransferase involved in cell wall biosynthesis
MNKVAIITRTKNREILLNRAVKSVLNQTYDNWLHVIINDGGNTEEVDKVVQKYKDEYSGRLKVIHNESSVGMEAASNIGINNSESDFVVIHDDDDSWDKKFLGETMRAWRERPLNELKGIVTHTYRVVEEINKKNEVEIKSRELFKGWVKNISLAAIAAENLFPPIAFIYRREVFDEIGFYNEDLPVLGDWEFNLRFFSKFDVLVLPKPLANYHHREKISSGAYSNTVIAGFDKHRFYENVIKNELMRKDIQANNFGLGYLVNYGDKIFGLNKNLNETKQDVNYLYKIAKKIFDNKIIKSLKSLLK